MKSVNDLEKNMYQWLKNLGPKVPHRFRLKVPEMEDHVATTQNRQITEIRTAKSCVGELMPWGPSFLRAKRVIQETWDASQKLS